MMAQKRRAAPQSNRRKWNRVHLPPVQYDLLLHMGLFRRISEEYLYRYIFRLMLKENRAQVEALLLATEEASGEKLPDDLRAMLDNEKLDTQELSKLD